jgi:hypothetical protein
MSGDIVKRLRRIHGGSAVVEVTQEAADQIERLRAAGDALAEVVAWWGEGTSTGDAVLAAWEEARRER